MSITDLRAVPAPSLPRNPDAIVKIDLDDRAYIFPEGKPITQLHVMAYRGQGLRIEALYAFNQSRASPVLFEIPADDASDFLKRLVEAVYRAQSCQIVSPTLSLSIAVVANGYLFQLGGLETSRELMVSTGSIWRVCAGLARALDAITPIATN